MKVIFLDVDGVLNTFHTTRMTRSGCTFVDNRKVDRLAKIIACTGAKVVLSSDWRYDRSVPGLNDDLNELICLLKTRNVSLFGYTPEIDDNRGKEITKWLYEHPDVESFVILDDRSDMGQLSGRLIQTSPKDGLTENLAQQAISMLMEGESV